MNERLLFGELTVLLVQRIAENGVEPEINAVQLALMVLREMNVRALLPCRIYSLALMLLEIRSLDGNSVLIENKNRERTAGIICRGQKLSALIEADMAGIAPAGRKLCSLHEFSVLDAERGNAAVRRPLIHAVKNVFLRVVKSNPGRIFNPLERLLHRELLFAKIRLHAENSVFLGRSIRPEIKFSFHSLPFQAPVIPAVPFRCAFSIV